MVSAAILIANAHYAQQSDLECCLEDLAAMKALLESIGRHTIIKSLADGDADAMRDLIRDALASEEPYDEIFFYFSGHGAVVGSEFFYFGTTFDPDRPNETGLSHTALHDLLRSVEPNLLVKVIDACASGTLLVKADRTPLPLKKEGFHNVVQFSSSLDDQSSFGGDPLSEFTRAFCEACIRKTEGPVYYSDVSNTLRDDFLGNDDQTPFFVSQGTGRELLVDDAAKLTSFREEFRTRWGGQGADDEGEEDEADGSRELVPAEPPAPKELLMAAEERMGGPEQAKALVDALFDGVLARFHASEFADFFELQTVEHSDFREPTARDLIIKVLVREARPDNFVTAEIKQVKKKLNPWDALSSGLTTTMLQQLNPEWTEHYTLELNCRMERAQLRLTLVPKYRTLQQLVLVLSCAPSLEECFVFEVVTQHLRTDWDGFDYEGREAVRRWYRLDWDESVDGVIEKICLALEDAVRTHIDDAAERLT